MESVLPRHKRTSDLRQSAYQLKEALCALIVEHSIVSDVYQSMLQAHLNEAKTLITNEQSESTEDSDFEIES
jgi:hypothetical protein